MRRWFRFSSLIVLATTVALAFGSAPALASTGRSTVHGTAPGWANSANYAADTVGSDQIGFRLYLGWNNQSQLESFIQSVSDPASASYGKYLTPDQFRASYAPSAAAVGSVSSWLQSQGFSVVYIPGNNHYVSVQGTIAQATAAFGTKLNKYNVNGMQLRAPASDISVPSSIAGYISGAAGLDESHELIHTNMSGADPDADPSPAFVNAKPCSSYWGEQTSSDYPNPYGSDPLPWVPCGYTPQQVKGAYGFAGTKLTGANQTVGIIDAYASPTIVQDVNQWSTNRGLPQLAKGQLTQVVAPGTYNVPQNPRQDPQGWYGEETLDIEAVHGMAPGAKIVYVGAPNNYQDLDAAMNHFVDRHLGNIVTNSYGFNTEFLPTGFIKPLEQTFMQGAAEGIGIYFSSGDNSDETFGPPTRPATVDWPATSPYVTAVGGTSLAVGPSNDYLFETGWGTARSRWISCPALGGATTWCPTPPGTWIYGSGGGVSCLFARPSYQSTVTVTAGKTSRCPGNVGRAVPDVAAVGDPNTGYLIGQTQTFPDGTSKYSEFRIGGTSLSSPIFAGLMALADQATHPHGFANPVFYAQQSVFTDIVDPASTVAALRNDYRNGVDASLGIRTSLRTMNQTLTLQTTPGWDNVTGLGTPTSALLGI